MTAEGPVSATTLFPSPCTRAPVQPRTHTWRTEESSYRRVYGAAHSRRWDLACVHCIALYRMHHWCVHVFVRVRRRKGMRNALTMHVCRRKPAQMQRRGCNDVDSQGTRERLRARTRSARHQRRRGCSSGTVAPTIRRHETFDVVAQG